uniref:Uncharacterized protein n=1 Tax=Knipowitschia caucasica TaxID=637954 RepID=A0AAV2KTK5_KNICA
MGFVCLGLNQKRRDPDRRQRAVQSPPVGQISTPPSPLLPSPPLSSPLLPPPPCPMIGLFALCSCSLGAFILGQYCLTQLQKSRDGVLGSSIVAETSLALCGEAYQTTASFPPPSPPTHPHSPSSPPSPPSSPTSAHAPRTPGRNPQRQHGSFHSRVMCPGDEPRPKNTTFKNPKNCCYYYSPAVVCFLTDIKYLPSRSYQCDKASVKRLLIRSEVGGPDPLGPPLPCLLRCTD